MPITPHDVDILLTVMTCLIVAGLAFAGVAWVLVVVERSPNESERLRQQRVRGDAAARGRCRPREPQQL